MRQLRTCKQIFIGAWLVGILVLAIPSLTLVRLPSGEKFSELYLLGPGHMTEGYPFNVTAGEDSSVFIGVVNHLGYVAYYDIKVKLRNATEPLPNATMGLPSDLPELLVFHAFVGKDQTWETTLNFAFLNVVIGDNASRIGNVTFNNATYTVNKSATWDSANNGYYYEVFMELWAWDSVSNAFNYNNRFVGLWLNLTATA